LIVIIIIISLFCFIVYRCAKNVAGKNTKELRAEILRGRCRRTSIGIYGGNRPDSRCHTINSRKYGRYVRNMEYKACVFINCFLYDVCEYYSPPHIVHKDRVSWPDSEWIYIFLLTHRLNAAVFDVCAPKTKRCGFCP
jgi:hypothetical protein